MISIPESTPLIIQRNELLRLADDMDCPADQRLQAMEQANYLSMEIRERAYDVIGGRTPDSIQEVYNEFGQERNLFSYE